MAVDSHTSMPENFNKNISNDTDTVIRTIHHAVRSAEGVASAIDFLQREKKIVHLFAIAYFEVAKVRFFVDDWP